MDLHRWLHDTVHTAPPTDHLDHSAFSHIHHDSDLVKRNLDDDLHRHDHDNHPHSHRQRKRKRHPISSNSSSSLPPFTRRPRRKTRLDRYQLKSSKKHPPPAAAPRKPRVSRRRAGDGAHTAPLVQSFRVKNHRGDARLTVCFPNPVSDPSCLADASCDSCDPMPRLACFSTAKLHSRSIDEGQDVSRPCPLGNRLQLTMTVPDLVFNELKFLQDPRERQEVGADVATSKPSEKKRRKTSNDEHVSAYFGVKTNSAATTDKENAGRKRDVPRKGVRLPPTEKSPLRDRSVNVGHESGRAPSEHTGYYTWSKSPTRKVSLASERQSTASSRERRRRPLEAHASREQDVETTALPTVVDGRRSAPSSTTGNDYHTSEILQISARAGAPNDPANIHHADESNADPTPPSDDPPASALSIDRVLHNAQHALAATTATATVPASTTRPPNHSTVDHRPHIDTTNHRFAHATPLSYIPFHTQPHVRDQPYRSTHFRHHRTPDPHLAPAPFTTAATVLDDADDDEMLDTNWSLPQTMPVSGTASTLLQHLDFSPRQHSEDHLFDDTRLDVGSYDDDRFAQWSDDHARVAASHEYCVPRGVSSREVESVGADIGAIAAGDAHGGGERDVVGDREEEDSHWGMWQGFWRPRWRD